MAEIKKAKFPATQLPALDALTSGYLFRFRIVSQDKNRKSAWSTIQSFVPNYTYVSGDIGHFVTGNVLSVTWDPVGIEIDGEVVRNLNSYDVWLSWNSSPWTYLKSVSDTSVTAIVPSGATTYAIKIYHKTSPATQIASLELYSVATTTI